LLNKFACVGVSAMLTFLAPLPSHAQTIQLTTISASATTIPNRASVRAGTHRARAHHRGTLNRQKARATAEHARKTRASPVR
jgi:hypothetical protein